MTPPYVFALSLFFKQQIQVSTYSSAFSVAAVSVFSFVPVLYTLTGLLWSPPIVEEMVVKREKTEHLKELCQGYSE